MNIKIIQKKKTHLLNFPKNATVLDLKKEFVKISNLSIHRQCFKLVQNGKTVILDDHSRKLQDYNVTDNTELVFKDFGPQIGYRTVFVIEYLGPLLIVLLYSLQPQWIYGNGVNNKPLDPTAKLGIICWTLHFLKRELETIFVHRFSRPTMPLFNLFKNSIYYWSFGLVIGYPLCHPFYTSPVSSTQVSIGLTIFAVSEVLNFMVHWQLRNLRPKEGSKVRPIPKGLLFSRVSCPNYTFEVLGWVGFSILTQIFASYVFTIIGFVQMTDWALKKHSGYKRSYGVEYKRLKRHAIIPFLL